MADDNDIVVLDDVESTEESYVNLVSYVKARFDRAKMVGILMKNDGYKPIETIVVYTDQTYNLQKQKSLAYLLK